MGFGVLVGTIVAVEVGARVCANKVTAADCAVLFTSVRLIVGDVWLVEEVPQAANNPTITRDIIDTRFEIFFRNSISISQNRSNRNFL